MPRNPQKNQQMRDERRDQILTVALELFAVRGLAATRISDIVAASGISQGLMYHYFRSKEEIFVELIRTAFEKMNTACRELEKMPLRPREKIEMALIALLKGLDEHEQTSKYHLLINQASASEAIPEEARAIIRVESRIPYEVIERIIAAGQVDGTLRNHDPAQLALVFWTSIKGLALHKAVQPETYRSPDPRILMEMFFNT